jgi:2-oxoglutarate dehydrogenase E1 component
MSNKERFTGSLNVAFVEALYADYQKDPASVPSEWQGYFEQTMLDETGHRQFQIGPSCRPLSVFNPPGSSRRTVATAAAAAEARHHAMQDRVDQMIRAYRIRGHMIAKIDPLELPRPKSPELDLEYYGFSETDLERTFSSETLGGTDTMTLREIVERLRNTYCRSIGVQFMHIYDLKLRGWLLERMESTQNHTQLSRKEQIRIFTRLTDAVSFEEFIRKKFIGAKSFSLEGAESLIPLLDMAIEKAGEQKLDEVVLGMAHRGRLNVLANIMGKNPRAIFREFEDKDATSGGDVKYHMGYSTDWVTETGRHVHLTLCFNPSHLEYVNPVALGRVRAKQDRAGDTERRRKMAILIHGDASFMGEGVVQESLNLSMLHSYRTGGTLHIIVNNQIGFTTTPSQGRSTTYATGIAKMLQIPIFHVNGEDPEAVSAVIRLAMDFRHTFKRDVVVDMYGYRRLGHNESDEPSFTQPLLYRAIEKRKSVREGYLEHLLKLGGLTRHEAEEIAEARREHLEKELSQARSENFRLPVESLRGIWSGYKGGPDDESDEPPTGVEKKRLQSLLLNQTKLPADFNVHPKIEKILESRQEMAADNKPLDWAAAESLALATLATEGCRIRLTGQDAERGTFSHRHAVLHDYRNGHSWCPLQHLSPEQASVEIANSPLSEVGVLGFEYGYSLDTPDGLVIWEAQFGDFVNCAQVIIDQFITSAEEKWKRLSGLVMLLPHGFEGQGPEHSSARLERFLGLAANDNIQVAVPTTPAQLFHLLRRQVLRRIRKPLVILTPKSLLRHPSVISPIQDLVKGAFQRVIPDEAAARHLKRINRILLCSGKIYYELLQRRDEQKADNVAIIRVEQLYPLPDHHLAGALSGFAEDTPVVWTQEEPSNMGAWPYWRLRFGDKLLGRHPFTCVARPASASPATGSANAHKREQAKLLAAAIPAC